MSSRFALRASTSADHEEMAMTVHDGFEGWRDFGPAGWEPPSLESVADTIRARHAAAETWSLLALDGDEVAGHVTVIASTASRKPGAAPELAELWQLFVRPP